MRQVIERCLKDSIRVKQDILKGDLEPIIRMTETVKQVLQDGGKLLLCGNGGSAADSQHIAAELIGRFAKDRKAFPAIALTTDTSILTSLGNDYGYDTVFSRQVEGLGRPGDVLLVLSTSGNSPNACEAVKKAKALGLKTISLTGGDGGQLRQLADMGYNVPSSDTARIQEAHICIAHIICAIVEEKLS